MKKLPDFTLFAAACCALAASLMAAEPASPGKAAEVPAKAPSPAPVPGSNQLTAAEKAEGWELLFDGATFKGWRGYGTAGMPAGGWAIENGMIRTIAGEGRFGGGEIITERKFDNFEFSWEWCMSEGGNNGVKYFVTEERRGAPGPEYQMIDDERHADAKRGPLYRTGAFYDVLVPIEDKPLKKPGEWNLSKLVVRGSHVEHWLNGKMILSYEAGSAQVMEGVARSKFKNQPGFGEKIVGHLMLTYHFDACWFRNLKVRDLK
jgi:hypothetical protein